MNNTVHFCKHCHSAIPAGKAIRLIINKSKDNFWIYKDCNKLMLLISSKYSGNRALNIW